MSRSDSARRLTSLSYQQVVRKARAAGFIFRRRTSGTHEIWWNEQRKQTCVIPRHKEILVGTLRAIIRQMGISRKEFLEL